MEIQIRSAKADRLEIAKFLYRQSKGTLKKSTTSDKQLSLQGKRWRNITRPFLPLIKYRRLLKTQIHKNTAED